MRRVVGEDGREVVADALPEGEHPHCLVDQRTGTRLSGAVSRGAIRSGWGKSG